MAEWAARPADADLRLLATDVGQDTGHYADGRSQAPSAAVRLARFVGVALLLGLLLAAVLVVVGVSVAQATPVDPSVPVAPASPTDPAEPSDAPIGIEINGDAAAPSTSIVVLLGITLLSVAPSLLLMMTSFTRIFIVLVLSRNALGLQGVPPNQILAGLALFLSIFIMSPVISGVNTDAVQPYLAGDLDFTEALGAAEAPLRGFMLGHTREADIALLTRAADLPNPQTPADVPFQTLVPAFMLSELRAAFIIGFVIFVPFLVIDLVVSAVLMSMGMMMLPPVMISLPFKILLFILVDGWSLITRTLVGSY